MKSVLLASAAALVLAGAAQAQTATPIGMWSGVYVGLQTGHAFDDSGFDFSSDSNEDFFNFDEEDEDDGSFEGGAFLGADMQNGMFVFGALLDANWLRIERERSFHYDLDERGIGVQGSDVVSVDDTLELLQVTPEVAALVPEGGYAVLSPYVFDSEYRSPIVNVSVSQTLEWYGTARVRLGVAPGGGRVLFYATGGGAFGGAQTDGFRSEFYAPSEANANFGNGNDYNPFDDPTIDNDGPGGEGLVDVLADPACAPGPILANDAPGGAVPDSTTFGNETSVTCEYSSSESETLLGWSLGGGIDVLVTDRFSVKAEYLFVSLGDVDFDDEDFDYQTDIGLHSVRFGGAYRF